MKKIISLLLTFAVCLSICACTKNTDIELTLDNIENYFDIEAWVKPGDTTSCMYEEKLVDLYTTIKCSIAFTGNPNYEFVNVVIGIKFTHNNPKMPDYQLETTIYVKLNLAGKGNGSCDIETPIAKEPWNRVSSIAYNAYNANNIINTMNYSNYEFVSVTGTAIKL